MKTAIRNTVVGTGAVAVALASVVSLAADIDTAATAAITAAQSSGISVGGAVVACVAALCVVGIVLSMIKKV
ncbi:hypothetical protein [Pseudomonas huanghezhanensis]|uniref:hypothetical protein n=1 Tax=Pseudomonas huanghezhanensis TaxID=3002903 RepID=UPI002285EFC5|nr:hypothetical protein [Pseudomonas sp. BSw22131]